jgi:predicted dehydrogenase
MDIDKDKCDMAKKLGADEAVSTDLIRASDNFTQGYGADSVIITAATKSNQPVEDAAAISRLKGRIVVVGMVGMDIPREPFYKKELNLRLSMSYGPGRYDVSYEEDSRDYPFGYVRWTEQRNMQSFLTLVADDKVTPSKLITHRFPIDKALEGYDLLEHGRGGEKQENYIGIVIIYPPIDSSAIPSKTVKLREVNPNARNNTGVGFIGAGNFAKSVLVPALKKIDNVQLLGLCTATGISGTETGKKHGFAYATTDYQQLLADERIDAVFVTTHHNSHAHFACEALASGKNVFVEKPLCLNPEDFGKFQDALETAVAKNYNPVLMVGFNRRFSRHARVLKNVFTSRTTPLIISYRISAGSIPKDTWIQKAEIGGGRIIGEVCHFVDFCGFLIDASPVRVFADCIASDNTSVTPEDSVVITISYSDGSIATIQYLAVSSSVLAKERAEIHADGITAVLDNFTKTEFFGAKCKSVKGKQDKGFNVELNEFFKVIRQGGQWPIPLENLIQTTKVTFAIVESLRLGQPVSLLG